MSAGEHVANGAAVGEASTSVLPVIVDRPVVPWHAVVLIAGAFVPLAVLAVAVVALVVIA